MMLFSESTKWNIDINRYVNPILPSNHIFRLPKPISHFLGYRDSPQDSVGNILVAVWSFLGAFVGLLIIEAFFMIPSIRHHDVPLLIASFGAAAVLEYNAIDSPLAQPRNALLGHIIAATIGISITKLFTLNSNFEDLRWIAGALACGLASALMTLTKTIYPPAGATALLAAVDPQVERLGWYLLPLVCLSAVLTLVVSLLMNNVQRQYPMYWWTPAELGSCRRAEDIEKIPKRPESSQTWSSRGSEPHRDDAALSIHITSHHVSVPVHLSVGEVERSVLEVLRARLGESLPRHPESTA